jgi:hypothetical protein
MLAWPVLVVTLFLAGGAVSPTPGVCSCMVVTEDGGWCDVHDVGYIGGVEVESKSLFEVLDAHGHDVDLATFECPSCRQAIESDGFCEEHRVGFVDERAYFSKLSYHLARGERVDLSTVYCRKCRLNAASHGWCGSCRRGMVGRTAIRDRKAYEEVVRALALVERADATAKRCPHCAAAMVTDTRCPMCAIGYRDGVATPEPPGPLAEPK